MEPLRDCRWARAGMLLASAVICASGGCRCGREPGAGEAEIDVPDIVAAQPDVDRPRVVFPASLQSDDPSLNEFIRRALGICERGDYDGFRQLFSIRTTPTSQKDFERVWLSVQEITVAGVYAAKGSPDQFFVHAIVRYRKPDRKGRLTRDAALAVFKESGYWRIGPAPTGIIRKMRAAATQVSPGALPGSLPSVTQPADEPDAADMEPQADAADAASGDPRAEAQPQQPEDP